MQKWIMAKINMTEVIYGYNQNGSNIYGKINRG
jgi:hypothetical protein